MSKKKIIAIISLVVLVIGLGTAGFFEYKHVQDVKAQKQALRQQAMPAGKKPSEYPDDGLPTSIPIRSKWSCNRYRAHPATACRTHPPTPRNDGHTAGAPAAKRRRNGLREWPPQDSCHNQVLIPTHIVPTFPPTARMPRNPPR